MAVANHKVIQDAYLDQGQGALQPICEASIGGAGLGHAGWMVVGENNGCGVLGQGGPDDFAGVDARAVESPAKHLLTFNDPVAGIEKQANKDFIGNISQPGDEIGSYFVRAREWTAPTQTLAEKTPSQFNGGDKLAGLGVPESPLFAQFPRFCGQ